jgi:glycine/D-amino acid oxidase-like deaminating enzyme
MSKRIVIIGGGLAGLSTAYHLDGASYALLTRGPGWGAIVVLPKWMDLHLILLATFFIFGNQKLKPSWKI